MKFLSCPQLEPFLTKVTNHAEAIDRDFKVLKSTYQEFCDLGYHTCGTPPCRLIGGSEDWFEWMTLVAKASGSLAWLAIQQYAANPYVANLDFGDEWPTIGGAYGHLRAGRPDRSPQWNGDTMSGLIPWYSGAHIFEKIMMGFFLPDGTEAYALVDGKSTPNFTFSEPKSMIGCDSTANVSITLTDFPLSEDQILCTGAFGTRKSEDDSGVLNQVPLSLGVCFRALELIVSNDRIELKKRIALEDTVNDLYARIVNEAQQNCHQEKRHALRAEATELSLKLSRIAIMSSMPAGISPESTGSRLMREATFFACVGGQNQVIDCAIDRITQTKPASAMKLQAAISA